MVGTFESTALTNTFTDTVANADAFVPLRVIYWSARGKLWQLAATQVSGSTSVREESLNYSFASYDATAVTYDDRLILCGAGQQARAYHTSFVATDKPVYLGGQYVSSTGSVTYATVTSGSATVSGASTTWSSYLAPGMKITFCDGTTTSYTWRRTTQENRSYTIGTVSSNTSIVLTETYSGATRRVGFRAATTNLQVNLPFLWDGRLGFVGSEPVTYTTGTVSVTNSAATCIGSGTSWVGKVSTSDTINIDGTTYAISAVVSDTSLTLASNFSGSTNTAATYTIYTGGGDYNTLYFAGDPDTVNNNLTPDPYDWMYVDPASATVIGYNEGAIQRVVPLEDRMVVFLQNAIYEVRGTVAIDFSLGSNFSITRIRGGLGLSTYDSCDVGTDGQTIYFGSPDGMYRLYGNQVEAIDLKIRDHEGYRKNMQFACYFDNRVYFTDATDAPTKVGANYQQYGDRVADDWRQQLVNIWVFDIPSNSWTYFRRLTASSALYAFGLHGGLFNPYRGDLTVAEKLMVGAQVGCKSINDATSVSAQTYHESYITTPHTDFNDLSFKRVYRAVAEFQNAFGDTSITVGCTMPATGRYNPVTSIATTNASTIQNADTLRNNYFGKGGRGVSNVSATLGFHGDYEILTSPTMTRNVSLDYTTAVSVVATKLASASFSASLPADKKTITAIEFLIAGGDIGTMIFYLFDSSGAILTSGATYGGEYNSTWSSFYWYRAPIEYTIDTSLTYYIGYGNDARTAARETDTAGTYTRAGGVFTTITTASAPCYRVISSVGDPVSFKAGLNSLSIDYIPLPGRKR
jgi:hypothetical protein